MRYLISGINQIEIFHSFLSYRCSNTHVIYTHCEKKFSLKHLDRTIPSQLQHVFTEAPTSRVSPAIFLFLFQYNYKYICIYMFQHIYIYIYYTPSYLDHLSNSTSLSKFPHLLAQLRRHILIQKISLMSQTGRRCDGNAVGCGE